MFDKDDQEISQIIEAGLEAIVSGRATLEEVVAQHPEHAQVLRAELEVALWLVSNQEQVAPRPGFVAASRKRVVSRIKEEARNTGAKRSIFGFIWPHKITYQWVAALLAFIILFSGTGGLVSISQKALPGEELYAVKQASESVALAVTVNEVDRVALSASYVERRVDEVVSLIQAGEVDVASETLPTVKKQVSETVAMLMNMNSASAQEKKALAYNVQDQLEEQAEKLEQAQAAVPGDLRLQLEDAETLTMNGATLAGAEGEKIFDPIETPSPSPAPSLTVMPGASPSPAPTDTPVPQPTDTESAPTDEVLDDPSPTPDPTDPSSDVTKTPKPTNENRPTKQPDPGGGSKDQPDNPVKPDNPAKPDKPDPPGKPDDKPEKPGGSKKDK